MNPAESTASAGARPLGQLGRYRLIKYLGVGGQAEVFKANYSGPGGFERTVVVKRILPANCGDPEFLRMFAAEAARVPGDWIDWAARHGLLRHFEAVRT